MATTGNGWEDASNVGITQVAGANVDVQTLYALMLAKLVGAPILSAGVAVVTIFRHEAAAGNGGEGAASGRVT
jgi:hypothetical protein